MSRDKQGKFIRPRDEIEDLEDGFLNRPPNNKMILVFLLILWLMIVMVPKSPHERVVRSVCTQLCTEERESQNNSIPNSTDTGKYYRTGL